MKNIKLETVRVSDNCNQTAYANTYFEHIYADDVAFVSEAVFAVEFDNTKMDKFKACRVAYHQYWDKVSKRLGWSN